MGTECKVGGERLLEVASEESWRSAEENEWRNMVFCVDLLDCGHVLRGRKKTEKVVFFEDT